MEGRGGERVNKQGVIGFVCKLYSHGTTCTTESYMSVMEAALLNQQEWIPYMQPRLRHLRQPQEKSPSNMNVGAAKNI